MQRNLSFLVGLDIFASQGFIEHFPGILQAASVICTLQSVRSCGQRSYSKNNKQCKKHEDILWKGSLRGTCPPGLEAIGASFPSTTSNPESLDGDGEAHRTGRHGGLWKHV